MLKGLWSRRSGRGAGDALHAEVEFNGMPSALAKRVRRVGRMFDTADRDEQKRRRRERSELALAAARVPTGQTVVELGALFGQATCFLALGAAFVRARPVWAFDRFRRRDADGRHEPYLGPLRAFRKTIRRAGVSGHVIGVALPPTDAATAWDGSPVGLLVLDAGSGLASCAKAYDAWLPHLADGALVVLRDCRPAVRDAIARDSLRTERGVESLRFCVHTASAEASSASIDRTADPRKAPRNSPQNDPRRDHRAA